LEVEGNCVERKRRKEGEARWESLVGAAGAQSALGEGEEDGAEEMLGAAMDIKGDRQRDKNGRRCIVFIDFEDYV
jgi:hypothetical protein